MVCYESLVYKLIKSGEFSVVVSGYSRRLLNRFWILVKQLATVIENRQLNNIIVEMVQAFMIKVATLLAAIAKYGFPIRE